MSQGSIYHRLNTVEEFVLGARYTILDRLVEQSDIITINTPLTPQTDGTFNRDLFFRMKKGAYLINSARGRCILSLVQALEKGHLAGYVGDICKFFNLPGGGYEYSLTIFGILYYRDNKHDFIVKVYRAEL